MENKEMNTEKIKFYKKHPVLLAWLISIFIGLGYALFTIIASVIHYEQRDYVWEIIKAFTEMFTWAILMGAVLVFPVVLTISEVICLICEERGHPVKGDWLFDQGGIARGKGMMVKGTDTPEMVLSPVLASDVLNPVKNEEFDRFVRDMGIMFGAAERYAQDTRMEPGRSTSNDNRNYSHQTFINGVEIGDSMLDRPLSEVLSLLGLHRNY